MSQLNLLDKEIHVWIADFSHFCDTPTQQYCREIINKAEANRAARFYFRRHRARFLATRGIIRTLLSHYVPEAGPAQWQFKNGQYGKPYISTPAVTPALSFNLSHSENKIVVAVSRQAEIGIDVEFIKPRRRMTGIARRHFAAAEYAELIQLKPALMEQRFFDLWTLKEAYIKASGEGLAIPLGSFVFQIGSDDRIEFSPASDSSADPGDWWFWQFDEAQSYRLAVALKTDIGEAEKTMVIRQVNAFDKFGASALRLLRCGHTKSSDKL